MHVGLVLLLCGALVGDVTCECDKYIECIGVFLRDFFGNTPIFTPEVNNTSNSNRTLSYEFGEPENANIDKVLSEITSLIKDIDVNVKESEVINRKQNKTRIVVKTFEVDDDFNYTETTEKDLPTSTLFITTNVTTTTQPSTKDAVSADDITTTNEPDTTTTQDIKTTESDLTKNILFGDLAVKTATETTTADTYKVIPLTKDEKDNEIFDEDINSYTDDEERKFVTDYPEIDYIELYKDTTNELVDYIPTEANLYVELNELRVEIDRQEKEIENLIKHSLNLANEEAVAEVVKNVTHNIPSKPEDPALKSIATWIATIFLKNDTGDQFDYYCDGALVSEKAVLTAARCIHNGKGSRPAENFIVILGKTSLQVSGDNEKILRVKEVKTHENYTNNNGHIGNDLALLILEEPVTFNDGIAVANLDNGNRENANNIIGLTTAWGLSGDVALIYFDKGKSKACNSNNTVGNTFCATYGDEVALCPSYGGLYVTKQDNQLCLAGIRTGDPSDRGFCFKKQVDYTSLKNYTQWISNNFEA